MGRKLRSTAASPVPKMVSAENDDSGCCSVSNSASDKPMAIIKLRPLSSLMCDNSNTISGQFAFSDNSIQGSDFVPPAEPCQFHEPEDDEGNHTLHSMDNELSIADCKSVHSTSDIKPPKPVLSATKATSSPNRRSHSKFKKKLVGNYHKVTDFFSTTPRKNLNGAFAAVSGKENVVLNEVKLPVVPEEKHESNVSAIEAKDKTNHTKTCPPVVDDDVISISSSISDHEDSQFIPERVTIVKKAETKLRNKKSTQTPLKSNSKKGAKKAQTTTTPKRRGIKAAKRVCPSYKLIQGTSFAVDAFQYGTIEGVSHYFLTHFHSDHYVGLNKSFSHPIYMSSITARLARKVLKVKEEIVHEVELNSPFVVQGVEVTALDANHCPGSVMFLFKLSNGECALHVGDFRACPEMEMEPVFWNNRISRLYLDTTYLPSKTEHPLQMDAITEMICLTKQYMEKNIGEKYVIIVGSYVIGKERVWSELAKQLGCRVWLEESRLEAVECYADSSLLELLEVDPSKALIHVIPLQKVFYEHLSTYLEEHEGTYDKVLAIRPTGWEHATKLQKRGASISILSVQYSEHSSYSELERFVKHLQPEEVISTVPNLGKLVQIPVQWLSKEVQPKKKGQSSITSFLKAATRKSEEGEVPGCSKDHFKVKTEVVEEAEDDEEVPLNLSTVVHVD